MSIDSNKKPLCVAVLLSGNGSNLQAIIDAISHDRLNISIELVVSNKLDSYGIERAKRHGLNSKVIERQLFSSKQDFEQSLSQLLNSYDLDLIVLAGFMLVLSKEFVTAFSGKIINIHPSLLPKYKGLDTYQKALSAGDEYHGTTVHLVTEELDGGPIISQTKVLIEPHDTVQSLTQKTQNIEHKLYPLVLGWLANGRISINNNTVFFDNKPVSQTGIPNEL